MANAEGGSAQVKILGADESTVADVIPGAVNRLAVDAVVSGSASNDQGLPNTDANAWPVKITDGVNGDASIITDGGIKRLAVDAQLKVESIEIGKVDQGTPAVTTSAWPVEVTNGAGTIIGTSANPIRIDPTGATTQPISAASLPLPTGAATEATLTTRASEATLASANTHLANIESDTADIETSVANIDVLLSTRASEATLATRLADATFTGRINTQGQKTMAASTPVVIASDQSSVNVTATIPGTVDVSDRAGRLVGHVTVDSGSIIANIGTTGGLALDATLTSGAQETQVVQGGNTLGINGSGQAAIQNPPNLDVALSTRAAEHVTAVSPHAVRLTDGASFYKATTPADTQPVSGPVTQAQLEVELDEKLGDLGQKTMAGSAPVVIASDQSTIPVSATIPGTVDVSDRAARLVGHVTVDNFPVTQPVSGIVTANQGTPNTLANGWPVEITDGTNILGTSAHPLRMDPTGTTTQPISAASLPLPAGASTEATLTSVLADTADIETSVANLDVLLSTRATEATLAAILVDTGDIETSVANLDTTLSSRASEATLATRVADATITARLNTLGQKTMALSAPVVISSDQSAVAVTATIPGTVDVSDRAARLVGHVTVDSSALPAGAATEATLSAILTDTADIETDLDSIALHQTDGTQKSTVRGGSKGATVAADITSTSEGADHQALDVQIYHGGVAKDPTAIRALTAADVVTVNQGTNPWTDNVSQWGGSATSLGQKTMASSVPVVIASDQSVISVSGPLTQAQLETELDEKLGDLGQKTMTGSAPVVIASDQSDVGVKQATASNLNAQVVGVAANGSAVSGNPVETAGENAAGNVQRFRMSIIPPTDAVPGQIVRQVVSSIATLSNVASSASNVILLAANTTRIGATIVNDGNKLLYVKCGATASTTSFTKLLTANEDWQVPFGYTGEIDGIWSGTNGSARISEFT